MDEVEAGGVTLDAGALGAAEAGWGDDGGLAWEEGLALEAEVEDDVEAAMAEIVEELTGMTFGGGLVVEATATAVGGGGVVAEVAVRVPGTTSFAGLPGADTRKACEVVVCVAVEVTFLAACNDEVGALADGDGDGRAGDGDGDGDGGVVVDDDDDGATATGDADEKTLFVSLWDRLEADRV